jgi:hypothetical protein
LTSWYYRITVLQVVNASLAAEDVMPTYLATAEFWRMYRNLSSAEQTRFIVAVRKLVEGLVSGSLPGSLRIKRIRGTGHVWEMTWAPNGRASFRYGSELKPGHPHIIWLRIGGHEIFAKEN